MARLSKDMRKLLREVDRTPGWRVEDRGGSGWRVFPPKGPAFTVTHGPRQQGRHRANTIAMLRRLGYDI
jgi:hypothetical protein